MMDMQGDIWKRYLWQHMTNLCWTIYHKTIYDKFICLFYWVHHVENIWRIYDNQMTGNSLIAFQHAPRKGWQGPCVSSWIYAWDLRQGFSLNVAETSTAFLLGNFGVPNGKLRRQSAHKMAQNGIWVRKWISHDTCAEDVANLRVYLFGRHPFRWQGMACAFEIIWRTLLWSVLGVIWDLHPRLLLYLYIYIIYVQKCICTSTKLWKLTLDTFHLKSPGHQAAAFPLFELESSRSVAPKRKREP